MENGEKGAGWMATDGSTMDEGEQARPLGGGALCSAEVTDMSKR